MVNSSPGDKSLVAYTQLFTISQLGSDEWHMCSPKLSNTYLFSETLIAPGTHLEEYIPLSLNIGESLIWFTRVCSLNRLRPNRTTNIFNNGHCLNKFVAMAIQLWSEPTKWEERANTAYSKTDHHATVGFVETPKIPDAEHVVTENAGTCIRAVRAVPFGVPHVQAQENQRTTSDGCQWFRYPINTLTNK